MFRTRANNHRGLAVDHRSARCLFVNQRDRRARADGELAHSQESPTSTSLDDGHPTSMLLQWPAAGTTAHAAHTKTRTTVAPKIHYSAGRVGSVARTAARSSSHVRNDQAPGLRCVRSRACRGNGPGASATRRFRAAHDNSHDGHCTEQSDSAIRRVVSSCATIAVSVWTANRQTADTRRRNHRIVTHPARATS